MAVFTGAGVAIVTPFKENGAVDYEKFAELIEFQIAEGTDAIIVCGTTGESSTLTHEEHIDVIAYCVKQVNGRIPVVAGLQLYADRCLSVRGSRKGRGRRAASGIALL